MYKIRHCDRVTLRDPRLALLCKKARAFNLSRDSAVTFLLPASPDEKWIKADILCKSGLGGKPPLSSRQLLFPKYIGGVVRIDYLERRKEKNGRSHLIMVGNIWTVHNIYSSALGRKWTIFGTGRKGGWRTILRRRKRLEQSPADSLMSSIPSAGAVYFSLLTGECHCCPLQVKQ